MTKIILKTGSLVTVGDDTMINHGVPKKNFFVITLTFYRVIIYNTKTNFFFTMHSLSPAKFDFLSVAWEYFSSSQLLLRL